MMKHLYKQIIIIIVIIKKKRKTIPKSNCSTHMVILSLREKQRQRGVVEGNKMSEKTMK
jgi:hypothetical protein